MGFIRGAAITFACLLLFLSLFFMSGFLTISKSLDHDTVQPYLTDYGQTLLEKLGVTKVLENNFASAQLYCQNFESFSFNDSEFELNVNVPCDKIKLGLNETIKYGLTNYVDEIYYKEYDCEFWDCIKQEKVPFVLISEKSQDYWKSKFYIFLIISLVLFTLLFLLEKKKANTFIISGILLFISVFLFTKIPWLISVLPGQEILGILNVFFIKSNYVFLLFTIIAVLLFAFGLLLRIFGWGSKLFKWFDKKAEEQEKKGKSDSSITKQDVEKIVGKKVSKEIKKKELEKKKKKFKKK